MKKTALIPVADGVEDIETVAVVDVLRRSGIDVTIASVKNQLEITATCGTKLVADKLLGDCKIQQYDLIALPGGMPGAEHLRDAEDLTRLLYSQNRAGKLYAAICASPVVILQHHSLLTGRNATCHPSLFDQLENGINEKVVVDKNCITSQGPGTVFEFALKLVELLLNAEAAAQIASGMVIK